jgi:TorA maturation chaperone TorD
MNHRHAQAGTSALIAVAAMALQLVAFAAPVQAQQQARVDNDQARVRRGASQWREPAQQDQTIQKVFREVLKREPTKKELRRYRNLMDEEQWSERDIREDLRGRTDYRRISRERNTEADRIIGRAYEDVLGRAPDAGGLRDYRIKMIDQGWTEQDVREDLRKSPEHNSTQVQQQAADRIIRRAYQELLGREPDPNGLWHYRSQVTDNGWDEQDVRRAIMKSPEYLQKNPLSEEAAEQIVRRAYLATLGRDVDAAGMQAYKIRVLRDHWSEADVARALRNSDEYRNRRR